MRTFLDLIAEAEAYYATSYHGTGINNVKTILLDRQGLKVYQPRTTSGKGATAVYLTPNIQLAARYAMGGLSNAPLNRTPAILEIKMFGARRHKTTMRSDPLDRSDTAWSDIYDQDGPGMDNPIEELEDDIKSFVKNIVKRFKVTNSTDVNLRIDNITELQGFQLHQYIRSLIAHLIGNENFNRIKNDINRYINSYFPPDETFADGQVAITNSGTLQLTPDYWNAQHQSMYNKNIPASAIKSVWVRETDFPNAVGEKKEFGVELLPAEVVDRFESEKKKLEELGQNASKIIDAFLEDPEQNKDTCLEELEELKEDLDDDKMVDMINQLIAGLNDEDFNFDPILKQLERRGYKMTDYLNDKYVPGTDVVENHATWVRVEAKNVGMLFNK